LYKVTFHSFYIIKLSSLKVTSEGPNSKAERSVTGGHLNNETKL